MSTSPVPERIIDRIKRIRALTESSNENEAAVAAAKLTEMLQQYDLTLQDVEVPTTDPVTDAVWSDMDSRQLSSWRTRLSSIVANVTFCEALYGSRWFEGEKKRNRRVRKVVYFVGHGADAEVAKYLYETLAAKVDALATKRTSEYIADYITETGGDDPWRVGGDAHPMVFRNSWMSGALSAVAHVLYKQYGTFAQSSNNAKALIKVKDDAIAVFMEEKYPKLKNIHSTSSGGTNWDAYKQGQQDGSNIRASRALNKSTGTWQAQLGKGGAR